ncbi:MAG: hypothetical protein SFU98_04830 [Leptospiraceae bacterium]|nr:hypothetical protein [Leptospiraceae bacterium]
MISSYALNCLGVSKDLKIVASLANFSSITNTAKEFSLKPSQYSNNFQYSEESKNYTFSNSEIETITSMEESLTNLKINSPETIKQTISEMPSVFYYEKKSEDEIEAEVLDWDLALPTEQKLLTNQRKTELKALKLKETTDYFNNALNQISTSNEITLRTIRINSTIAISCYNLIKEELKNNPEIDSEFIKKNMEFHVLLREKAIDELVKRGLEL